jgi:DNA topoisomerase-1
VYVKLGPYGPYVQLGEDVPKAGKAAGAAAAAHADPSAPRRAALPAKVATADVTLEQALALLSLPRELGLHPEQQQPVLANVGRFGPYVKCGTVSAALPKGLSVSEVVLDVAVELLRKRRERLVARGIDPDAPLPKRGSKAKAGVPAAGKKASAASTAGSKATVAKGSAKRKPAARKAKQVAGSSEASSDAGSGRPAKPPSAYLLFCKQRRGELKASGLQASPQEMMRLLAAEWKALPEQQRQDLRESLSQAPAQPTV